MKKQLSALFAAGVLLVTMGAGCSSQATVTTTPVPEVPAANPVAAPVENPPATNHEPAPVAPVEAKKTPEDKPLVDVKTKVEVKTEVKTPTLQTIKMTAKKFAFEPSTVTVNKGDKVRLEITSADTVHGFSLSAFNVSADLEPGKTSVVEFVADKAGTFTFSCSVFCGAGHGGMTGTLIVK